MKTGLTKKQKTTAIDDVLEIADMDFCSVINAINVHYAA